MGSFINPISGRSEKCICAGGMRRPGPGQIERGGPGEFANRISAGKQTKIRRLGSQAGKG